MILGYRLRELRRENGMSQEDLGKLLGVTKVSVSGYENGNRVPSLDVLNQILDVFGVSADYLMGRELNVVCEDDTSISMTLSTSDIEIIREIRSNNELFNAIANNPKRFFSSFNKKNI
ncbi:MAG: helix-turn-helix transcriptional regulator [Bacilli bacterium]|nr:helix-turn-helix transcriptional regulator [Bacilli bacterium]